jgi:hypothetical protein
MLAPGRKNIRGQRRICQLGGLIDRGSNNAVLDPDLLDALVKGSIP